MKTVIGITGGSGSGKSLASRIFEENGASVVDADIVAREIVKPGKPALFKIKEAFGDKVIRKNGELDRRLLGEIVFSNKESLRILNEITHKYIIERIKAFINSIESGIIVIDAALLFQTGLDKVCDLTISVIAKKEIRLERIMVRDNLCRCNAENRISSQEDDDYYATRSDYIVSNDGNLEHLNSQITEILEEIL